MLRTTITHTVITLCALALPGCAVFGGGGPEDRVASLKRSKSYEVTTPTTWKSIDKADSDAAYKTASGSIATLTSSCDRDAAQPLELLTKHLLIGARKVQTLSSERTAAGGDVGLYSSLKAQLENRPFELQLFVVTHANCIFDFSLVSPKAITDQDGADFRAFFRSLRHAAQ